MKARRCLICLSSHKLSGTWCVACLRSWRRNVQPIADREGLPRANAAGCEWAARRARWAARCLA